MPSLRNVPRIVIVFIANLNAAAVLAAVFGGGLFFYICCVIAGIIYKQRRWRLKRAFLSFSKFFSIVLFIYCIAESLFFGKYFNLLSSLLTVSVFLLLSMTKYFFFPTGQGRRKKQLKKFEFGFDSLNDKANLNAENAEEDLLKVFEKIAKENSTGGLQTPKLENVKQITQNLRLEKVSRQDREEILLLEKLAARLKTLNSLPGEELADLNDKLGGLLKMLSKYEASI